MDDLLKQAIAAGEEARRAIEESRTLAMLEQVRIRYLGRKGLLREFFSRMATAPVEARKEIGEHLNRLKTEISHLLDVRKHQLEKESPVIKEYFDITAPGVQPPIGSIHPITRTIRQISEIFGNMGFEVRLGPEIENEYNNFEALNIPEDHPSRDGFDTFYIFEEIQSCQPNSTKRSADQTYLLRSHTSPVQIRVMKAERPPLRIIVPGRVFRPDTIDASHYPVFHQVEGLMVGEGVSLADLKAVLTIFAKEFFDHDIRMRFRPSFFPFTEPSAEVDISCVICSGKGCGVCKGSGWLEILGAGMVAPEVFRAVGYDTEKYTGFAFGMGVERIAMLKYSIDDIRLFFENDVRFLEQF